MIKTLSDLLEETIKTRIEHLGVERVAFEIDGYILQTHPEIRIWSLEEFHAREKELEN